MRSTATAYASRPELDCLVEYCDHPPPPPPTCEEECEAAGQDAFDNCIADGGGEDVCHSARENAVDACLVEHCEEPPPPPTCEEECLARAQAAFQECINEEGSNADECEVHAHLVKNECLEHECDEPPPPPPPSCEEICHDIAQHAFEECAARAERFLGECLEEHGLECVRTISASLSGFGSFVRGDVNRDNRVALNDVIHTLEYLFLGTQLVSCLDSADTDDNGAVNLTDAIVRLEYMVLGSNFIRAPFPEAGYDDTADALTCD